MIVVVADSNALMSVFRLSLNIDEEMGRLLNDWEMVVPPLCWKSLKRFLPRTGMQREHYPWLEDTAS